MASMVDARLSQGIPRLPLWRDTHLSIRSVTHSKVHGANMGSTWVLSAPDRPHAGPMNLAIRGVPGACITTAVWHCSKPISHWQYRSYLKAFYHRLRDTRPHHITVSVQATGFYEEKRTVSWTDSKKRKNKTSVTYKLMSNSINSETIGCYQWCINLR